MSGRGSPPEIGVEDGTSRVLRRGSPYWRHHCVALVPCLNEEQTIGPILRALREHVDTAAVIDDGSSDGTALAATNAGAVVLRNERPLGKGASLRRGWTWALERGFEWALNLDGDGQHSPADVDLFFGCAERTGASLVVGNRMGAPQGMPPLRRWVNRWMSRRLSSVAGQPLPDSQCGYRLMELSRWQPFDTSTSHFEIESEVLLSFIRRGCQVEFVPIRAVYNGERSKINPLADTVRWFRWWAAAVKAR